MVRKVGLGIFLLLGSSVWGIDSLEAVAQTEPVWYDCRSPERFTPAKQAWCANWQALQEASLIVPTSLEEASDFYHHLPGRWTVQTTRWVSAGAAGE